ncbi:MAG: toxin-antitoxin system YwqK family antitoxin [Planctomycetota bacterium]
MVWMFGEEVVAWRRQLWLPYVIAVVIAFLPVIGCGSRAHENDPQEVAASILQLSDPKQDVRDAAAARIREILARNPAAANDPGEAYWRERLKAAKPGMTHDAFRTVFGGSSEGEDSSGGTSSATWRLDEYWVVWLSFKLPDSLIKVESLHRRARYFWAAPPKEFTGRWLTYFVNGRIVHDIEYKKGQYVSFKAFHDNGQLSYEQTYVDGQIAGPDIGYYPDGKKSYEGRYVKGKQDGGWTHWYQNGKKESEASYVNGEQHGISTTWYENGRKWLERHYDHGRCTGEAAWDKNGKLQYAHGTAEGAKDQE